MIAQSVLELSHREIRPLRLRRLRRHQSGLNYSPRRKVFRRGQKYIKNNVGIGGFCFISINMSGVYYEQDSKDRVGLERERE